MEASKTHISGIQQVGIGTAELPADWKWYRKNFGMDIRIFEDAAEAPLMTRYTGGEVRERVAALAMNMQGGGGFEIWQYRSRTPQPANFDITLGDLGFLMVRMKTRDAEQAYKTLKNNGAHLLTDVRTNPMGEKKFYLADPKGNWFEVVQTTEFFKTTKSPTGGVYGMVIGVSDMDKAIDFYGKLLGFDKILSDTSQIHEDLKGLPDANHVYRRVFLEQSKKTVGPFNPLLGTNRLELVQKQGGGGRKIFDGRFWGDLGFIHMCFDVVDMDGLKSKAAALGHPFTVDSANSFDMGKAAGRFAYVEDPDGALIEFVETHKLPLVEKWGWYVDLKKRSGQKSLPKWLLSCFSFNRVKN